MEAVQSGGGEKGFTATCRYFEADMRNRTVCRVGAVNVFARIFGNPAVLPQFLPRRFGIIAYLIGNLSINRYLSQRLNHSF